MVYKNYWTWQIVNYLYDAIYLDKSNPQFSTSLAEISDKTALSFDDIITTLEWLDMIHYSKTEPNEFAICIERGKFDQLVQKYVTNRTDILRANPANLRWNSTQYKQQQ